MISKKHLHQRKIILALNGPFSGVIVFVIFLITHNFIAPLFISNIPLQPNIKDVTVIIPNGGVHSTVNSLRTSGFRKLFAISYDINVQKEMSFDSFIAASGAYGSDVSHLVNTSYVLYTGIQEFNINANLPKLPKKPMVIGYSFGQCHENGYALLLPFQLEYSLITAEAMSRFNDFSQNTLKHQTSQSEAFRIFAEFHSLHLLLLPCKKPIKMLPKWETIEVLENETDFPARPWDSIPKIEEVWRVRDLL